MNSIEIGQHNQGNQQSTTQHQVQQHQVVTPTMDETAQNGADNGLGKPAGCMKNLF
jgi:hypothetical protein